MPYPTFQAEEYLGKYRILKREFNDGAETFLIQEQARGYNCFIDYSLEVKDWVTKLSFKTQQGAEDWIAWTNGRKIVKEKVIYTDES